MQAAAAAASMARLPVSIFRSRRRARHTPRSFFLGTSCGHAFLLMLIMTILITTCAGVWIALGRCWPDDPEDPCLELADPTSYLQSMWLAWGIFFDPGTQTGLPPSSPVRHKFVLLFFTVCGFIFNLVVLGLVVGNLVTLLTRWLRLYHVVVANQHTVILGWTDRTLFLMAELAERMSSSARRGGTLVVLGDLPSLQMSDEVNVTYPDWSSRFPGVRLVLRQGRPYELSDLDKVSLHAAQQVVVMGTGRSPSLADSLTITTLSALRCLPDSHQLSSTTPVVLELQLLQNVSAARQIAGAPGAASHVHLVPVCAARAVDYLAVMCATAPSTGRALVELISSDGMEFHTFQMRKRYVGQTIAQIGRQIPFALIVGVVHAKEGSRSGGDRELSLVPPDDTILGPKDQLVLLTENEHEVARKVGCKVAYAPLDWDRMLEHLLSEQGPGLVLHQARVQMETLAATTRKTLSKSRAAVKRASVIINEAVAPRRTVRKSAERASAEFRESSTSAQIRDAAEVSDEFKAQMHARMQAETARAAARGRVILVVGWKSGFGRMLRAFDGALPADSHIYVVSAKTMEWRKTDLAAEGLDINGASMEMPHGARAETRKSEESPKKIDPLSNSAAERVEARRRHQMQYEGLKNVQLHHYLGDPTDATALRMLPLDAADVAYVLADESAQEDKAFHLDDAEAMTSTVLLRRLRAGLEASALERGLPPAPPLTLITQCVDVLTNRLLGMQPDLLDGTGSTGAAGESGGGPGGARGGKAQKATPATIRRVSLPETSESLDLREPSMESMGCVSLTEPSVTVQHASCVHCRSCRSSATIGLGSPAMETVAETPALNLSEPSSHVGIAEQMLLSEGSTLGGVLPAKGGTYVRDLADSGSKARRASRLGIKQFGRMSRRRSLVKVDEESLIESIVLHRNWLETAALSTAAIGGASWSIVRLLLDPMSPTRIFSIRAACVIADDELALPFNAGVPYSFWQLRSRLMALECGLLIGWRRAPQREERAISSYGKARTLKSWTQRVNPTDKDTQLQWNADDELLVIHFEQRHVNVFQGPAALAAEEALAKAAKEALAKAEHKAAESIQRIYHGFRGRRGATEGKSIQFAPTEEESTSAVKIQRVYRGKKGRHEAKALKENKAAKKGSSKSLLHLPDFHLPDFHLPGVHKGSPLSVNRC